MYQKEDTFSSLFKYRYDKKGNLIQKTVTTNNFDSPKDNSKVKISYNKKGKIVITEKDNKIIRDENYNDGPEIELLQERNNIKQYKNGYSIYNHNGKLVEMKRKDGNDEYFYTYKYDNKNKLIGKTIEKIDNTYSNIKEKVVVSLSFDEKGKKYEDVEFFSIDKETNQQDKIATLNNKKEKNKLIKSFYKEEKDLISSRKKIDKNFKKEYTTENLNVRKLELNNGYRLYDGKNRTIEEYKSDEKISSLKTFEYNKKGETIITEKFYLKCKDIKKRNNLGKYVNMTDEKDGDIENSKIVKKLSKKDRHQTI
jgi:hypothetical protein